jgi:hypothetical protein
MNQREFKSRTKYLFDQLYRGHGGITPNDFLFFFLQFKLHVILSFHTSESTDIVLRSYPFRYYLRKRQNRFQATSKIYITTEEEKQIPFFILL